MGSVRRSEGGLSEGIGGWAQLGDRRVGTVRRSEGGHSEEIGGWAQCE